MATQTLLIRRKSHSHEDHPGQCQSKHYQGVGNDVQKLHHAIDNLENMAVVRHEEDKMMALTKTALLKAVQAAKITPNG